MESTTRCLRRAHIGVALGARGSDVAREAVGLVITDDNVATIVTAVREGRGICNNIREVVDYLVAGNLSEVGSPARSLFDTTALAAADWALAGGGALLGVAGTVSPAASDRSRCPEADLAVISLGAGPAGYAASDLLSALIGQRSRTGWRFAVYRHGSSRQRG